MSRGRTLLSIGENIAMVGCVTAYILLVMHNSS